jgi:hypothetical protein
MFGCSQVSPMKLFRELLVFWRTSIQRDLYGAWSAINWRQRTSNTRFWLECVSEGKVCSTVRLLHAKQAQLTEYVFLQNFRMRWQNCWPLICAVAIWTTSSRKYSPLSRRSGCFGFTSVTVIFEPGDRCIWGVKVGMQILHSIYCIVYDFTCLHLQRIKMSTQYNVKLITQTSSRIQDAETILRNITAHTQRWGLQI